MAVGAATATVARLLVPLLLLCQTTAFYVPGWSIRSYNDGEQLPLMVNKIYSDNTQLQYAYSDLSFVCPPTSHRHGSGLFSGQSIPLSLGEVLRGDRISMSDMALDMAKDAECNVLCYKNVTNNDIARAGDMIEDGYMAEWIVDNLPGATSFVTVDKTKKYYAAGFKLGYADLPATDADTTRYYLHNHHTIVIRWRKAPGKEGEQGGKVVVGFEVYPKSVGPNSRDSSSCPKDLQNIQDSFEVAPLRDDNEMIQIPYTYSVYWRQDDTVEWSNRWDLYFVNQEDGSRIHWVAIANSLIICGLLTGSVLIILAKTVRKGIQNHRDSLLEKEGERRRATRSAPSATQSPLSESSSLLEQPDEASREAVVSSDDEAMEEVTGWKLLHGEVFRPPQFGYLLAPLVGSGMQLLIMATSLVILHAFGFLNPSVRGGFISAAVDIFVAAGFFSGCFSAKVFQAFGGRSWQKNAIVTGLLFPGLAFGLIFILNLFVWSQASSTVIPFGTLVILLLLLLLVQGPLVYLGAWVGFVKTGPWGQPTKTARIFRKIPSQPWYFATFRSILLSGIIPFAVIFIELLFIFNSVWQDKSRYSYVFGYLAAVSLLLMITIAEVTVVAIYVQLCSENWHWWWQSFAIGGSSAVWVFGYSVWYYFAKLQITGFVSSLLFFSYSAMACCVYALLTGTVGFLAAFAFVMRIYGAIKVD